MKIQLNEEELRYAIALYLNDKKVPWQRVSIQFHAATLLGKGHFSATVEVIE